MDIVPITKKLIAFGTKKIYLPKFTIALVRSARLSPYHAKFLVPLDFSKYDLRDYLFHAYNVKCFNIRSYIRRLPVRDAVGKSRQWFRPDPEKYMTVEMEEPFVWPAVPNLSAWNHEERKKDIEDPPGVENGPAGKHAREAAKVLRAQAHEMKYGAKDKSRLERWEQKRTAKIGKGDRFSGSIIKA